MLPKKLRGDLHDNSLFICKFTAKRGPPPPPPSALMTRVYITYVTFKIMFSCVSLYDLLKLYIIKTGDSRPASPGFMMDSFDKSVAAFRNNCNVGINVGDICSLIITTGGQSQSKQFVIGQH